MYGTRDDGVANSTVPEAVQVIQPSRHTQVDRSVPTSLKDDDQFFSPYSGTLSSVSTNSTLSTLPGHPPSIRDKTPSTSTDNSQTGTSPVHVGFRVRSVVYQPFPDL